MKVIMVSNEEGDWEGIYIDGKLKHQDHSIASYEILEALGIEFEEIELTDEQMEKLGSSLPEDEREMKEVIG